MTLSWAKAARSRFLLSGLAVLIAIVGVIAFRPLAAEAERPFGQGLLWRVEKTGLHDSYVFGTMHSADERILNLPEPVAEAFAGSNSVVLELLMDNTVSLEMVQAMILTDGRVLPDIVGEERFERVTETGARYGMTPAQLQLFQPWAVMTFFSLPSSELARQSAGNLPLDQALQAQAKALGKELYGLESITEQLAVFGDLSAEDQIALLDVALDLNPDVEALFTNMKQAYLAGDLDGLHKMAEEQNAGTDPALADLFEKRLIDSRNQLMAERVKPQLDQGGAFVAIGALHLSGEEGLLQLLENQGFTISRAY